MHCKLYRCQAGLETGIQAAAADRVREFTIGGSNDAPIAVAGANQTVNSGAAVTLNGSASNDPDGDALSYQWTQTSGTAVTIANASSASASFTAPTVNSDQLLQFQLGVSDGALADVASTAVTVRRAAGNNAKKGGSGSLDWLLLAALLLAALPAVSARRLRVR